MSSTMALRGLLTSKQRFFHALCLVFMAATWSLPAFADFHLFEIQQLFSNADGTVQFIVLRQTPTANGEHVWRGHTLVSTRTGSPNQTYTFATNLPSSTTSNKRVLIGTQGFAALRVITPDYVIPNGFLATGAGRLNYADVSSVTYSSLPTDGVTAIDLTGTASSTAIRAQLPR